MNWTAIGATGQILGTVAVLVTLVYLALQVRLQRAESRRALSQGRIEAHRDLIALELEGQNLSLRMKADAALGYVEPPIVKLLMKEADLTEDEAKRVMMLEVAFWNYRLHVITNIDDLPPPERLSFDGSLRARYGQPGVSRLFYQTAFKRNSHPDTVQYVEDIMATSA